MCWLISIIKGGNLNGNRAPFLFGVRVGQGEGAWHGDVAGSLQYICAACVRAEAVLLWSGVIHVAVWPPLKRNSFWGFVFRVLGIIIAS